ncbi:putative transposase [Streptomyces azureus]|uniref:Putative transposase n=1 Tax=Streptomyces azureus TaxID=146537 RepID=A0A0K8PJQ0_STRAJ|nr:putative transposase [Streptomyces azureus]
MVSGRTVTKLLTHLGLNRRRFIDLDGNTNRKPKTIVVWDVRVEGAPGVGEGVDSGLEGAAGGAALGRGSSSRA